MGTVSMWRCLSIYACNAECIVLQIKHCNIPAHEWFSFLSLRLHKVDGFHIFCTRSAEAMLCQLKKLAVILSSYITVYITISLGQDHHETRFFVVSLSPDGNKMSCSGACALAADCLAYATKEAKSCTLLRQEADILSLCVNGQITCYRKTRVNGQAFGPTTQPAETTNATDAPPTSDEHETTTFSAEVTTSLIAQSCVESIRKSGSTVFMSFYNSDLVVRYLTQLSDIMNDVRDDERSRSVIYPDFPPDVLDAFRVTTKDLFTVEGKCKLKYIKLTR